MNQQAAQMDDFAECIVTDRKTPVPGEMGRRDIGSSAQSTRLLGQPNVWWSEGRLAVRSIHAVVHLCLLASRAGVRPAPERRRRESGSGKHPEDRCEEQGQSAERDEHLRRVPYLEGAGELVCEPRFEYGEA